MIVEDEPIISIDLEAMAAALDWTVVTSVHSSIAALVSLAECKPTAVLIDINLGGSTGFDVADRCRKMGIPVVFTTGYDAS